MQLNGASQTFGDGLEGEKSESVSGEVGLRDSNATPVHHAIDHLGAERRMRPALARRDHVAMRVKRDHRTVPEAPPDDKVGCRDHPGGAHEIVGDDMALDFEPKPFEEPGGNFRDRSAIAGRVGGGSLDELRQETFAFIAAGSDVGQDPVLHDGGKPHAYSIGQA